MGTSSSAATGRGHLTRAAFSMPPVTRIPRPVRPQRSVNPRGRGRGRGVSRGGGRGRESTATCVGGRRQQTARGRKGRATSLPTLHDRRGPQSWEQYALLSVRACATDSWIFMLLLVVALGTPWSQSSFVRPTRWQEWVQHYTAVLGGRNGLRRRVTLGIIVVTVRHGESYLDAATQTDLLGPSPPAADGLGFWKNELRRTRDASIILPDLHAISHLEGLLP